MSGDPPADEPAAGATAATDPGGAPADDPASADHAATGDPDAPPVVNDQDVSVDARSDAVADSGHRTATTGPPQIIVADAAADAGGDANPGVGLALVVSGDATAIGGTTDDAISQKALVKALGTGEIEIVQIALVVNLGLGIANTGANDAAGLDGAAPRPPGAGGATTNGLGASHDASGFAAITTGDATAVGNVNDVAVVQAANAAAGSGLVASDQTADISSLGVAFGNTGLNLAIGNTVVQVVLVDQAAAGTGGTGVAGSSASATNQASGDAHATGLAAITTGAASATGNASSTTIDQLAVAEAADGGFVSILQRALVLNLGIALANTGMNTAVGNHGANHGANLGDVQRQSIATAFWASLQSLFGGTGWLGLTGTDGAALVATGDATALGLAATTDVSQQATGSADAGGQASIRQDATVTNAGLAIANSGANDATGLLALDAVIAGEWAGLGDFLTTYLADLGTGAATGTPATSSWALGDVLVHLFGEIHADEVLIDGFAALAGDQIEAAVAEALGFAGGFNGITGTGPGGGPRIRVRQVTGTLTIDLGVAATGGDTAETATVDVMVVDEDHRPASEEQVTSALGRGVRAALQAVAEGTVTGDTALDPAELAVLINAATGSAVIATGDATAVNGTTIAVCQTFETSAAVCDPATPGSPGNPGNPTDPTDPTDPSSPADPRSPVRNPTPGTTGTGTAVPGGAPALVTGGRGTAGAVDALGTGADPTGELPRTGADLQPITLAGAALLVAGIILRAAAGMCRRWAYHPAHLVRVGTAP